MNAKTTKIIAVLAIAVIAVAGLAYVLMDDDDNGNGGGGGDDGGYISFFLYDNYEYDQTAGLLSQKTHLANGFWVKGYGNTKVECFKDACERAGIDVLMVGDGLATWGDTADGNYCHMGWVGGKWTSEVWLGSYETYRVKYMAIGHGRWSGGSSGNPPTPWQTPDDIKWYYGESNAPGNGNGVKFYFYDNYENDPEIPQTSPYPSKTDRFVADGYWVTGYGETISDAFKDACKKAFGSNVALGYNDTAGTITRIGNVSSNLHSMQWDGTEWAICNMSSITFTSGMSIAIGHGIPSESGPPTPWQDPSDMSWSL